MEKTVSIQSVSKNINAKYPNFISHLLHGLKLKSYTFNKYKTKKR